MNYPVSGVQVNIGYDSFYFKDNTTAWAYIKAINNLDAINNNEAHHATFNSSAKIGSDIYDTSKRPQNYNDGSITGQSISELGCNCGAVMMGAIGASTSRYSSVNEVLENPNLLKNQSAENFITNVELPNNWKAETLKRGSNKGGGYKATEYDPKGNPTGKYIRYNPGSKYGRKEGAPYWRVSNGNVKSEPIKGK
ncbi:hypothetical protein MP478_15955 [Chryseobacterium sp. WG14]|uniref:hypothetical protein n=1 Tax=Chryseobacterium sp. WG14 TaxID=2926909 RepID=UPI00211EFD30|nr:hypothetical protein [Chryseobacterium sp. WG14]MCQ9640881.1 hypothetical protein [Chryseobacterium sp. WG14]